MADVAAVIVMTPEELDARIERAVRRAIGTAPTLTVLTAEQAAERLGVGRKRVNELCRLGAIAAAKVGRGYRIKVEDLESYMRGGPR